MDYLSSVRVLDTDYKIKDEEAARINHTHKVEEIEGAAKEGHKHQASDIAGLSTVATSGSYSDLSGKPSAATANADGLMSAADKKKLDAAKTTADDAYSRTLRIELVSVPADAAGDTSQLTAYVYRGGELLSDQDVAQLGLISWYVDGARKATGWTYTGKAGTAVECRLEE